MTRGIVHKLGYSILVLWGVVTVVFLLFNVLPGDPARLMMGQRSDPETLRNIKKEFGFDRPLTQQYLKYLNDLSPISVYNTREPASFFFQDSTLNHSRLKLVELGAHRLVLKWPDLRRSYQSRKNVADILTETFPNTLVLAFSAMAFATLVGLLIGIAAALQKDSLFDRLALVITSLGMSIPSFFAAILMGWFFAFVLGSFTGLNLTGNLFEYDDLGNGPHLVLKNLILPAITLGIRPLSVLMQLSRNSMLEVLSQDYIRTARAKGLSPFRIIFRHALRNAMNPVVTAVSGWFASLLAGVVFIEYIFGWKGIGYVIVDALNHYDFPLVMGCVLIISLLFVVINILVDLIYGWLDPRIRISKA